MIVDNGLMAGGLQYSAPVPVSAAERAALLAFARRAAEEAGRQALRWFRTPMQVQDKAGEGAFDPVTEADRACERALREAIGTAWPEHGLYGEEFGHQPGNGLTWVIDPIDGTRGFAAGLLHWGLLLALFDGQRPVIGVLRQPFVDETFWGDGEQAGYQRAGQQEPLAVRACADLSSATLATTSPDLFKPGAEAAGFAALSSQVRMTRYGGDCYHFAALAMGQVDLALEAAVLAPYDIQALIPLIEGAGGRVTAWDGGDPAMGGNVLASGDAALHDKALELLNSEP